MLIPTPVTAAITRPSWRPLVLPATNGLDTARMHRTFDWIEANWDWESTWGWDYPLMAMSATRLGLPDKAIDAHTYAGEKKYLPS